MLITSISQPKNCQNFIVKKSVSRLKALHGRTVKPLSKGHTFGSNISMKKVLIIGLALSAVILPPVAITLFAYSRPHSLARIDNTNPIISPTQKTTSFEAPIEIDTSLNDLVKRSDNIQLEPPISDSEADLPNDTFEEPGDPSEETSQQNNMILNRKIPTTNEDNSWGVSWVSSKIYNITSGLFTRTPVKKEKKTKTENTPDAEYKAYKKERKKNHLENDANKWVSKRFSDNTGQSYFSLLKIMICVGVVSYAWLSPPQSPLNGSVFNFLKSDGRRIEDINSRYREFIKQKQK